jgi:AraC-like DNA-binding protein/DNA gyrase inhibitor GyrI
MSLPSPAPSRCVALLNDPRIQETLRYLEQHMEDAHSGSALAQRYGLSMFYFNRLFREQTGEALGAYVRRLRLDVAALRLHNTAIPAQELAMELGWCSAAVFTRAFKARFGLPPNTWRQKMRLQWLAPPHETLPNISIGHQPVQQMLVHRYQGEYAKAPERWSDFLQRLPPSLRHLGGGHYAGLAYDDPVITPAYAIRHDCCVCLPSDWRERWPQVMALLEPSSNFTLIHTRPGRYARLAYEGPYSDLLRDGYGLFNAWSRACRYTLTCDPMIEFYEDDHPLSSPQRTRVTLMNPIL